ncbi:MAG: hypothetical protein ABIH65_04045 [Nanoarchaeota archaeon]
MNSQKTNSKYQPNSKLVIAKGKIIPIEKILAFEQRLYNSTRDVITENEMWKESSLEKSMTYVI